MVVVRCWLVVVMPTMVLTWPAVKPADFRVADTEAANLLIFVAF